MAQIDDAHTVEGGLSLNDEVLFHVVIADPTTGYDAPVGSLLLYKPPTGEGHLYKKYASANSAWKKLASKSHQSASNPTVNNDISDTAAIGVQFEVGDTWTNTTNSVVFVCTDSSTGNAVWKRSSRVTMHDAVVSPSLANGDYTSIAAAFAAGNKTVYVNRGAYLETSDIILPNNASLICETGTLINFSSGAYSIKCDASGGVKETTGTISINKDSSSVVGVGTSFTNLSPGQYIQIEAMFFEIDTITDDLNLDVVGVWNGSSVSGEEYVAQTMFTNISLSNFTVIGSSADGIYIRGVIGVSLERVVSLNHSGNGISVIDCYGGNLMTCVAKNCSLNGINISGVTEMSVSCSTHGDNNNTDGIKINDGHNIFVSSSSFTNNDGIGCNVTGVSYDIHFSSCVSEYNDSDGMYFASTTKEITVSGGSSSENGGIGINSLGDSHSISGVTIDGNIGNGCVINTDNTMSGCQVSNNGGVGVYVGASSVTSTISGNHIHSNTGDGLYVAGDVSSINGCIIRYNGGYGIQVVTGAEGNTLSGNIIRDNTSGNIYLQDLFQTIVTDFPVFPFFMNNVVSPSTSDWAVTKEAKATADPGNESFTIRGFDDSTEEGCGFSINLPIGAQNIIFELTSRANTASATNIDVVPRLYAREIVDNAAVESWTAGLDMTPITMGNNNVFYQIDKQSIPFSSLGLVAGRIVQIELTRSTGSASDTLAGDWNLLQIQVSFT